MFSLLYGWTWFIIIPAGIFAFYAQSKVRSAYARASQIPSRRGYTGAQAAQEVMYQAGITDVEIEPVPGELSDHYDPTKKVLRLSEGVYASRSLAALGIAAHEAGHAIQHASAYPALAMRSAVVPIANLGTMLGPILFMVGIFFFRPPMNMMVMNAAIALYSGAVLFTLITLPVEFNASRRAIACLTDQGIIAQDEIPEARRVLSAAAWTYVAAAAVAISQLIRLLVLRNMYGDD